MNLLLGDCLEQLKTLPDNSVDSVVTDPPYFLLNDSGKGFMGKEWDSLSRENVIVESLLKSMHLSLDKKDVADFAQELVLTKQEALVLCKGLLPSLITVVEKLPDHVQFVQNHLFTVLSTPRSTVQNIADMWQGETKWLAQTTTSTFTDNQSKTSLVTEGQSGNGSESKSTSETTTDVNDATSIAVDSKSSVTTSCPIAFQEVMKKVISSPSVKAVIKQFTSIPHSMAIISAAFHERWAREVLRVLKPGGHMLAFSGTRVYQHLATGVEASGFECRDMVSWIHGQGFPKSHNVSKAIDKEAGAEREVVGLKDLKKPNAQKAGQSFSSNLEEGSTNKTMFGPNSLSHQPITTPATDLAKKWDGWGSALKPSLEPIILARKPLSEKTLAQNVVKWNCGGLNIDATRITNDDSGAKSISRTPKEIEHNRDSVPCVQNTNESLEEQNCKTLVHNLQQGMSFKIEDGNTQPSLEERLHKQRRVSFDSSRREEDVRAQACDGIASQTEAVTDGSGTSYQSQHIGQSNRESETVLGAGDAHNRESHTALQKNGQVPQALGRWPSHTIFDEEAAQVLDEQSGNSGNGKFSKSGVRAERENPVYGKPNTTRNAPDNYGDTGGASRFFYVAKASKSERNAGLNGMPLKESKRHGDTGPSANKKPSGQTSIMEQNHHPTVKPIKLMEYLIKLITPCGGTVLDPFMGSGSTGVAAKNLGMNFIGIEREPEYFEIAKKRIS